MPNEKTLAVIGYYSLSRHQQFTQEITTASEFKNHELSYCIFLREPTENELELAKAALSSSGGWWAKADKIKEEL